MAWRRAGRADGLCNAAETRRSASHHARGFSPVCCAAAACARAPRPERCGGARRPGRARAGTRCIGARPRAARRARPRPLAMRGARAMRGAPTARRALTPMRNLALSRKRTPARAALRRAGLPRPRRRTRRARTAAGTLRAGTARSRMAWWRTAMTGRPAPPRRARAAQRRHPTSAVSRCQEQRPQGSWGLWVSPSPALQAASL